MTYILAYVMSQLGMPYLYGGKHPSQGGWDCSGLIENTLLTAGINEVKNQSSQGIYDALSARNGTQVGVIKPGAIVFYGKDVKNIDHVAFAIDNYRIIESAGGDHTFTTIDPAQQAAHHAGVRIRLINYRPDRVTSLYPSYVSIGLM